MRRHRRESPSTLAFTFAVFVVLSLAPGTAEAGGNTALFLHGGGGVGFYEGAEHPYAHVEAGVGFHTFFFYVDGGFQLLWNQPGPYAAIGLAIPIPIVRPLAGLRFGFSELHDPAKRDFQLGVQLGAIIRKPGFPLALMATVEPGGWAILRSGGFPGSNHSLRVNVSIVVYPPAPGD